MEENKQIKNIDWMKHYAASAFIYGIILIGLMFCPAYYNTIKNPKFDYTVFFTIYYLLYLFLAPIIFFITKPKSVLNSRSLTILEYFKRQLKFGRTTNEFLSDIEPKENEKLALMTLFIQTFFGVYCVNTLANVYLPDLGYNLDFVKVLFLDAVNYVNQGNGILNGFVQFIIDSGDVIIKLLMTIMLCVLAISYLSELHIFRNKIKSADTTMLGILSCVICYYPVTVLTQMFIKVTDNPQMPVNNTALLATLLTIIIIANIGMLIAILRLGTKSGNLTNRGIVTGFPYNIVRHPEYTMQIIFIFATSIPLYLIPENGFFSKIMITITTFIWIYIYYLRAITEERHLMKDEAYQQYVEKTKYRFIPKLF